MGSSFIAQLKPKDGKQIIFLLFVLKNPGKDSTDEVEKDWDAKTTREKEKEWFAEHPQYKDIQHVCGIDRLMDTMISLLVDRMRTQIPILLTEMKKRKKEVTNVYGKRWRLVHLPIILSAGKS